MADDSGFAFTFPAIRGRKITTGFDGGRLTSDGGVLLLAQAERRLGIADRLAGCIADPRDQGRVIHRVADILRARMLAIACGYEDADDLDARRHDPGFKKAMGKLPGDPFGLASQPTMSRWENAPTTRELIRLTGTLIDLYCASYPAAPAAVTLDIDDTVDVVHGTQQLSFWNAHHGERCFLPIHVYDTATGRPVAMLLRTGKTPSGAEVAGHVRRLVRRIRRHWPETRITLRGDGHYGRPSRWRGARRTASTISSACPATPHCTPIPSSSGKAMPWPPTGRCRAWSSCAAMPKVSGKNPPQAG